ncbi:MAG: AAA family ATPase, partial [Halioglobus sp.]
MRMYTDFYQLHDEPFQLAAEPRFLYAWKSYRKSLSIMQKSIEEADSFLVVTGPAGVGKSTLVSNFLSEAQGDKLPGITLSSSDLMEGDLLGSVSFAFGVDSIGTDQAEQLENLERFLKTRTRSILIIDEAQNLSDSAFDELRLLTYMRDNLRPLLQIFLVGQDPLHERVRASSMARLCQRDTPICRLEPLSLQETHDFVLHRLACAGWNGNPAIATNAFILIHRFSQGIPLHISKLCELLFLHGAVEKRKELDAHDIAAVIRTLRDDQLLPSPDESTSGPASAIPQLKEHIKATAPAANDELCLTAEELKFISGSRTESTAAPRPTLFRRQPQARKAVASSLGSTPQVPVGVNQLLASANTPALLARSLAPAQERLAEFNTPGRGKRLLGRSAVAVLFLTAAYQWGTYNADPPQIQIANQPDPVPTARALTSAQAPIEKLPAQQTAYILKTVTLAPVFTSPAQSDAGVLVTDIPDPESGVTSIVDTENQLNKAADVSIEIQPQIAEEKAEESPVDQLLSQAEEAFSQDRLRTPPELSAWSYYQQVLKLEPDNTSAKEGIQKIAVRYAELTAIVMEKQQYDKALLYANRGLAVAGGNKVLMTLKREAEQQQKDLLATQEKQRLLAMDSGEATKSKSEDAGFFGALKKL